MNHLKLTSLAALTAATLALPMAASAQTPEATAPMQAETMKCGAKCGAMHKKMAKCGAMHKKTAKHGAKCGAMHHKMAKCGAKHGDMAKSGAKCAAKCGAKN